MNNFTYTWYLVKVRCRCSLDDLECVDDDLTNQLICHYYKYFQGSYSYIYMICQNNYQLEAAKDIVYEFVHVSSIGINPLKVDKSYE